MSDKKLHDLEQLEDWDYEKAERRPPVRKPREVVSVSFGRDEFEQVSKYAERQGAKTSEFIRTAALDATQSHYAPTIVFTGGGLGVSVFTTAPAPATRAYSVRVVDESCLVTTT
ncbi:MAG TPA: hypothetical protein VJO15_02660 [Dehalococcoidia bacterium]|nr:hypothetical protein [Dehalococcoidia bacterium]